MARSGRYNLKESIGSWRRSDTVNRSDLDLANFVWPIITRFEMTVTTGDDCNRSTKDILF